MVGGFGQGPAFRRFATPVAYQAARGPIRPEAGQPQPRRPADALVESIEKRTDTQVSAAWQAAAIHLFAGALPEPAPGNLDIGCRLSDSAGTLNTEQFASPQDLYSPELSNYANYPQTMALQGTTAASSADTITLMCFTYGTGPGASATAASIDAIQVGSINGPGQPYDPSLDDTAPVGQAGRQRSIRGRSRCHRERCCDLLGSARHRSLRATDSGISATGQCPVRLGKRDRNQGQIAPRECPDCPMSFIKAAGPRVSDLWRAGQAWRHDRQGLRVRLRNENADRPRLTREQSARCQHLARQSVDVTPRVGRFSSSKTAGSP